MDPPPEHLSRDVHVCVPHSTAPRCNPQPGGGGSRGQPQRQGAGPPGCPVPLHGPSLVQWECGSDGHGTAAGDQRDGESQKGGKCCELVQYIHTIHTDVQWNLSIKTL